MSLERRGGGEGVGEPLGELSAGGLESKAAARLLMATWTASLLGATAFGFERAFRWGSGVCPPLARNIARISESGGSDVFFGRGRGVLSTSKKNFSGDADDTITRFPRDSVPLSLGAKSTARTDFEIFGRSFSISRNIISK